MDLVLRRFEKFATETPDRPAVVDDSRQLSFAELDAHSDRLAESLSRQAAEGARIFGYLGSMRIECVSLNIAIAKAGLSVVALNPDHPVDFLREIITHVGIDALVTTANFSGLARELIDAEPVLAPLDAPRRSEIPRFKPVTTKPDHVHCISSTSGSSGRPKSVGISRQALDARTVRAMAYYATEPTDVCTMFNPFWWHMQLWPLAAGASLACFDFAAQGPKRLEGWLRENSVSVFVTYIAMYRQLVAAAKDGFPGMRMVIAGGEAVRLDDLRAFERLFPESCTFNSHMACQELGPICMFSHRHGDPLNFETVPLGRILYPGAVRLVNDAGLEVPPGQPGEIVAEGDFVCSGYVNDPARTAAQFQRGDLDQWQFRTGDLAYADRTGQLHSLGRKDAQVKIRGFNVRPQELEEALIQHPEVAEVAVVSFVDHHENTQLAAHIVAAQDNVLQAPALRAFLINSMPGFQVPNRFIFHSALPRLPNGKIDRQSLPAPPAVPLRTPDAMKTSNCDESTLIDIWKKLLGHDAFTIDDDFFDVGGDSLLAMGMIVAMEDALAIRVPLESLTLRGASIASIALHINELRNGHGEFGVSLLKRGDGSQPIYVTHLRGGHMSDYLPLLSAMTPSQTVYGLPPRGLRANERPDMSMRALAENCAQNLRTHAASDQPARLLGYSFGALLAFETARVLIAGGTPVSHLVLLDPPAFWTRSWPLVRSVRRYVKGRRTGLSMSRRAATLMALLRLGPTPRNLDEAHFISTVNYRPDPLAGIKTLHVLANDNPERERYRVEWSRLLGQSLQVLVTPGTHFEMLRPPHHAILAATVHEWLVD